MKAVRIALTGFGSVGQGVATLLLESGSAFAREYTLELTLTGVADRAGAAVSTAGLDPLTLLEAKRTSGTVATHPQGFSGLRMGEFLDAARADVLVEAASTSFQDAEPGWSYCREALDRNMHVVLASKGSLVLHYDQLMRAARARERRVLFAGATGAPLPVNELADRVLVAASIRGFEGIVNATSNFILTKMAEGASFEEGVLLAQQVGIAETDPSLDVDGWDAAAKTMIIARSVLGAQITLAEVSRTGIRSVTPEMLREAGEAGNAVKLIARAQRTPSGLRASVGPEARPAVDTLGQLRGMEMGIVFETERLGRVGVTVQETGGIPTALTVLRDVVNLARAERWTR